MNVMLLGATGLTGQKVLRGLLDAPEVSRVVAPVRSPLAITHPKLDAPVVNFDELAQHATLFQVDTVVCCLGTTIKTAGSREAFRRVDHHYPLQAAKLAKEAGARYFLLMSAVGAKADTLVFYSQVKGQLEEALKALHFDGLFIYQPGLLLAKREEFRSGEVLAGAFMPLINKALVGKLSRYRGIGVTTVANAMVREVRNLTTGTAGTPGVQVRQYDEMQALASQA
ncbi:MAG: NAD(P)H-binding protein [Marinobacter sp.]|nr:NAD(P)H-binding protein [Marinobacter sp.]